MSCIRKKARNSLMSECLNWWRQPREARQHQLRPEIPVRLVISPLCCLAARQGLAVASRGGSGTPLWSENVAYLTAARDILQGGRGREALAEEIISGVCGCALC